MRGLCDEDKIREHVVSIEGIRSAYKILVAEPKGK